MHRPTTPMNGPLAAALLLITALATGCSSLYYGTMERFGYHKRDLLVEDVQEARESQVDAKKQFQTTLQEFAALVNFDGGELESKYNKLKGALEDAESRAKDVNKHVNDVEKVGVALFSEWKEEIGQFQSAKLKAASSKQYRETLARFRELLAAMRKAESKMEPVLASLRDHVLYLKHSLNARAIASLKGEVVNLQGNVSALVKDMESAINEADAFIQAMEKAE